MLTDFAPWSNTFLQLLVDAALRALILAAAAGLGLSLFRVRSTSLRLFTWTGVLYAALALPFLCGFVPAVLVPVPSIVHTGMASSALPGRSGSQRPEVDVRVPSAVPARNVRNATNFAATTKEFAATAVPQASKPSISDLFSNLFSKNWAPLAGSVYLAIALLLLTRLAIGMLLARRLASCAQTIRDPRVLKSLGSHLQSRIHPPTILQSDLVTVPITFGTRRAVILLPANWDAWDDAKLDAVIAHELSHVMRRDALTQFLSRLYRAFFWFNPLSWWLNRQIHLLAEQASDEAALSAGVDRSEYARALLGFFETLEAGPGRVWWQGVSMASAVQAERRLERILSWRGVVHMGAKKSVLVAIVALAVPAVYLVAAVRPANHKLSFAQSSPGAQLPAVPAASGPETAVPPPPAVAPVVPGAPVHGVLASGVAAPALPGVPAPPGIPAAPALAWSGQSHGTGSSHNRSFYAYGFDDEQSFVIVSGNSDSLTMSGTSEDAHHVQRLKKQIPGDFIWFRRDEKSYIIRDQATVDRARKLWAPQDELGKKQEELGKLQEDLGKQQEELGAKMEQVRVNVPDMTAQLDALKAKLQKLGPTATMEQIGDLQSEIGELQSKMGEIQSQAGEQQSKFGEQQGALGEKQGKLGEEQGKIGSRQAELTEKATKQMKSLFDEAIKNGTAKPEPASSDDGSI